MSLNKYRNCHWNSIDQQKKEFVLMLRLLMQEQGIKIRRLKTPIYTKFYFYSYRGRDIDGEIISIKNFHDALCDPFINMQKPRAGLGLIHDDTTEFLSGYEVHSVEEKGNFFDVEIIENYKP